MKTLNILICDPISSSAVDTLRGHGYNVSVQDKITPNELLQVVGEYHVLMVRSRTKVTQKVIDCAANLRVIVRGGVGVDNIDVDYARGKDIKVLNTPAASTASVAELTIAFIFALARPIVQASTSVHAGLWEKSKFHGSEVQGKTLGIIGLGRIGSAVATRAAALGMIVLAYDACCLGPAPYMTMVPYDELLAKADYITLHVPMTSETRHLLDAAAFAKMKNGVKVIDCARGGVIDEEALYQALQSGKVAGAALDVMESEPPTDYRLLQLPQVVASPHIGAMTTEATERIGDEVVELLDHFYRVDF